MIKIKKIALKELQQFIRSSMFKKFVNTPISLQRLASYRANPRATNQEDHVLYMAFKNDELIGYRTLLIDAFFEEDKPIKFAWLSGSWVHPKYRRQGVSTRIFNDIYKDWEGRLMYTNYAVASKKLYDKTQQFTHAFPLLGTRYYTRFCSATLLPQKSLFFKRIRPLLSVTDAFFNLFLSLKPTAYKKNVAQNTYVKKNKELTKEALTFLAKFKTSELFKRDATIFNWIHQYPWIESTKSAKEAAKKYYFSLYAKQFSSSFHTFYTAENTVEAVLLVTIKDGALKIPYAYLNPTSIKRVAAFIIKISKKEKVKHLTIFNKALRKELEKTNFYLAKKSFEQHFFVSKKLLENHPSILDKKVQTGDGDVVFT